MDAVVRVEPIRISMTVTLPAPRVVEYIDTPIGPVESMQTLVKEGVAWVVERISILPPPVITTE